MKRYIKYLFTLIITFSTFLFIDNVYADDAKICIYDFEGAKDNVHIVVDNDGNFYKPKIEHYEQGTLYNVDKADKGTFVAKDYFLKNNYACPEYAIVNVDNIGSNDVYLSDQANVKTISDDIWGEKVCKLIGEGLLTKTASTEIKKSAKYDFTLPKECTCETNSSLTSNAKGSFSANFIVDSPLEEPRIKISYNGDKNAETIRNWFPTDGSNVGDYSYIKDLKKINSCPEFIVFSPGANYWLAVSDKSHVEAITKETSDGFAASCHEVAGESVYKRSNKPTPNSNLKVNQSNELKSNNADFMVVGQYKSCGGKDGAIIEKIPSIIPRITASLYNAVMVIVPVMLIIMGSIDLVKGIASQKEDEMKKGRETFIKRLIGAVLVFLIVLLVKMFVGIIAGSDANRNRIVHCIDCFISNTCDTIEKES